MSVKHYMATLSFLVITFSSLHEVSAQEAGAWAFDETSQAIFSLETPVQQTFETTEISTPPSERAAITAIGVQLSPSASAWVDSKLCVQSEAHCVPIKGNRLYTKAFNDFPANSVFYVTHQVQGWDGAYPPVFVKTQLNVWWE